MKRNIKALADALATVASIGKSAESKADVVLAIVKHGGITDLPSFNAAIREAYTANGWNAGAGKPKTAAAAVPATVKQYVSSLRAAFRLELRIGHYKTFYALRKAIVAKRQPKVPKRRDPRLAGLTVIKGGELTGAPFHDLTVLYQKLPRPQRATLAADVSKLVSRYQPAANLPELKVAA